jgi:hypothetical protein
MPSRRGPSVIQMHLPPHRHPRASEGPSSCRIAHTVPAPIRNETMHASEQNLRLFVSALPHLMQVFGMGAAFLAMLSSGECSIGRGE